MGRSNMPDSLQLMHGAQFAKEYVSDYLESDIPTRCNRYRNGWQLSDTQLPTPERFFTFEPLALDTWPTIITVVISTSSFSRDSYDGYDPLYRVTYQMRTYVWCRGLGSEEATIARDRLTTVVRSALLDYPCLQATDPRQTFQAKIEESTIREEFSDTTLLKGDRVMAGSYIGYEMSINEIVTRADIFQPTSQNPTDISLEVLQQGVTDTNLSTANWS